MIDWPEERRLGVGNLAAQISGVKPGWGAARCLDAAKALDFAPAEDVPRLLTDCGLEAST